MKKDLTVEDWKRIFNEYQNSNLKAGDFCRLKRITNSKFYYWRIKLNYQQTHRSQKNNLDINLSTKKNISKKNFISITEKAPTKEQIISLKISGHEISFSSLPDPTWIAKLILEVGNEST